MTQALLDLIKEKYEARGLKWPAAPEIALEWMHTEMGEVYEQLLARDGGWVRNNPDAHPPFTLQALAKEYTDVVMMIAVAACLDDIDVFWELEQRLKEDITSAQMVRSTAGSFITPPKNPVLKDTVSQVWVGETPDK